MVDKSFPQRRPDIRSCHQSAVTVGEHRPSLPSHRVQVGKHLDAERRQAHSVRRRPALARVLSVQRLPGHPTGVDDSATDRDCRRRPSARRRRHRGDVSGQLVGEVIAASETLRARGLSERGFQALIAIAEKANTNTRQASVRWAHIQAVQYGTSLSTAKRAIKELEGAGYVRKVKRGFNNQQGRSAARVYELSTMPVRADIPRTLGRITQHERVIHGDPFEGRRTGRPRRPNRHPHTRFAGLRLGPTGSWNRIERVKSGYRTGQIRTTYLTG